MAAGILVLALVLLLLYRLHVYLTRKKLPDGVRPLPGPAGIPFIGRVHDVPTEATWLKFYEWSKAYGPIYQMEIFGSVHVWISSEHIAHDLLSKRSQTYSDRPVIPNLSDNRTSGNYLALLGRTDTWKRQRTLCHNLVAVSAKAALHGYPTRERNRFLHLLGHDPDNYIEYVEQFTSRTVSRLGWGTAYPAQTLRKTTFGLLQAISPAGALPNVVSWLMHVPACLSPWKQTERRRHQAEAQLFNRNAARVQDQMATGSAAPSFMRSFLELRNEKAKWSDLAEATYVVGLMAIAGALTIGSPIQSYILAMCHYPVWQTKLQAEIDEALGGRCPEWEDRERLPLLRAVVKEVIRWRPPVPTGIPHALEKDDIYDGYLIPAGATIHAFEWAITRDETTYPDAETFNPERWLKPEYPTYREPLTLHPNLSGYSQFGFGRRTCQGVAIAEQDLFLAMGGMAWAFDMRKKVRAGGAEVEVPLLDFTALLIAKPKKFAFDAVVRSEEKRAAMIQMYEDAKDECDDEDLAAETGGGDHEAVGGEDFLITIDDRKPLDIPGSWR